MSNALKRQEGEEVVEVEDLDTPNLWKGISLRVKKQIMDEEADYIKRVKGKSLKNTLYEKVPTTMGEKFTNSPAEIISTISTLNIQGLKKFSLFKVNGKLLFFLGESHKDTPKPCRDVTSSINMIQFLDLFFTHSPVCCDFFLEQRIFFPLGEKSSAMYDDLKIKNCTSNLCYAVDKYKECFTSYNKEKCREFGNVRMHNIEYRRQYIQDEDDVIELDFSNPNALKDEQINKLDITPEKFIEHYRAVLIFLLNNRVLSAISRLYHIFYSKPDFENDVYLERSRYGKLAKQLYQLPSNVKSDLLAFYDFHSNQVKNLPNNKIITIVLSALIMDCYALARILKVTYVYEDSGLIFITAGYNHIMNYTWFFNQKVQQSKLLIDIDSSDDLTSNRCIIFSPEKHKILVDTIREFYNTETARICSLKDVEPPF